MGLTSSIEQPLEDFNYEEGLTPILNGEYSSWEDIKREIDNDKLEHATRLPTTSSTTEESSGDSEEADEEVERGVDIDEEALKGAVTEFVDEVIGHAVKEYNKRVREEMFARIPSSDDLYERSLEKHLEEAYEYQDEMTVRGEPKLNETTPENPIDLTKDDEVSDENEDIETDDVKIIRSAYRINSINNSCFRRHMTNLRDATMEFVEEMNGRRFFEDYNEEEEGELPLLNEYIVELLDREHDNIEELKRNCASLKTSYNLVKDRMTEFCVNNKEILRTGLYATLFYYLLAVAK